MTYLKTYTIPVLLLSLFLVSCGGTQDIAKAGDKGKKSESVDGMDRIAIQGMFYDASRAKILEDYQEAIRIYEKILKVDPTNDAAMYELASIFYGGGQQEAALKHIEAAVKLNSLNKWYLLLHADVLAYSGKYAEAADVYELMLKNFPGEVEYYFDWAFMLIKQKKYEDAIKVYNTYEEQVGMDENVVIQKQRLYIKMNQIDKAAAELMRLIDAYPDEPRYYGLLADVYQSNDLPEKAAEIYEKLLEIDPENPFALLNIAEMYRVKGERDSYMQYLERAFRNPKLEIDAKIRILFPYLQVPPTDVERKEEAFKLAKIVIETHPTEAKSHAVYGDLLYRDEQNEKALNEYKLALEIDNGVYEVWQQVFFIYSDSQRFKELKEATDDALELFPNQPLVYFFNGVALSQMKKYQDAVDILEGGKDLVLNNPILKAQFFSNLGDAYNNLKQYEQSDAAFDQSLKLDPDNPYTLNNYSYYLSLRNDRLEKAEKMSARSNELEPDNSSFQDTYGWILFQMKDYKDARIWIEKAMESGGSENAVILEHYGDILIKLGEKEKALEYWKKAEKLGSDSELIGKKIADEKFYE